MRIRMNNRIKLCVMILSLIIPVSGCSELNNMPSSELPGIIETAAITEENIGIARSKLASGNKYDTNSRSFKNHFQHIKDEVSNSSISDNYEYLKVTSEPGGIAVELSDKRLNKYAYGSAILDQGEYYTVWKNFRDSLANLSTSIYKVGEDQLSTPCDSSIYVLNNYDKDLVLLCVRNGKVVYDIMEELGDSYASAQTSQQQTTSSVAANSQKKKTSNQSSGTNYSSATSGQKNALSKADSYLRSSAFSYEGLVEQLEYEGYSHSDAVYAADHCGADWDEQALLKAKSYLKSSAFSESGLKEQLEYEGFTSSQAKYGVDRCGADWNEQAVLKAKSYLKYSSFSKQQLIDQLIYEGFTQSQAEYGVSKSY